MDSGFAEDAIHFDPCDAVFIAGEVAVRGKFKIHIAACTVRTGGAVSSYEVVAVDGNEIAFDEDSFVFVVAEVHEPVVDLCHIPLIADDDVYVVVIKVLPVRFQIVGIFKDRILRFFPFRSSRFRRRLFFFLRSRLRCFCRRRCFLGRRRSFRFFCFLHGFPGNDLRRILRFFLCAAAA